jgi:hypothetical protein
VAIACTVATPTVHLHCYFPSLTETYTADDFFAYLSGPVDDDHPRWAGIDLDFQTNQTGGVLAFQNSLRDPGSVVVYLGHSALDFDNHYSLGLSPKGLHEAEITDIERWEKGDWRREWKGQKAHKPEDLMSALKKSPAKVVILASCGSATIPYGLSLANFDAAGAAAWRGKVAGGPALVVTKSNILTTWSYDWVYALTAFLLDLIDYEVDMSKRPVPRKLDHHGTIQQALDAANVTFQKNKAPDTFVLVNGSGSTVVFPDRPLGFTYQDLGLDWENWGLTDDPQP